MTSNSKNNPDPSKPTEPADTGTQDTSTTTPETDSQSLPDETATTSPWIKPK